MATSLRNINAYFPDSTVDAALRNQTQGRPAGDMTVEACDQTRERKMRRVPRFPRRRFCFERRIARGDALEIDRPYLFPVGPTHLLDQRSLTHIRLDRYV